jgi:hypothetical protein
MIETRHRRPKQECIFGLSWTVDASAAYVNSLRNQPRFAPANLDYFSIHNMHRKSSRYPSEEQLTIDASKNASPFQLQT